MTFGSRFFDSLLHTTKPHTSRKAAPWKRWIVFSYAPVSEDVLRGGIDLHPHLLSYVRRFPSWHTSVALDEPNWNRQPLDRPISLSFFLIVPSSAPSSCQNTPYNFASRCSINRYGPLHNTYGSSISLPSLSVWLCLFCQFNVFDPASLQFRSPTRLYMRRKISLESLRSLGYIE